MENPLADRWQTRDFPVLVLAAKELDDGSPLDFERIAAEADLAESVVIRSVSALVQAGYLLRVPFPGPRKLVLIPDSYELTERGRRAVGIWPSGEGADALVEALRQAEEATTDPDEKTLIRRAAGALGSVSRDVLADVTAALIRQQTGI